MHELAAMLTKIAKYTGCNFMQALWRRLLNLSNRAEYAGLVTC
jgi:hypothetical protein